VLAVLLPFLRVPALPGDLFRLRAAVVALALRVL